MSEANTNYEWDWYQFYSTDSGYYLMDENGKIIKLIGKVEKDE